jgi:3-dehydroquinate dehydratase II
MPQLLVNLTHAKILLLNGPNLNLLGTREPEIYGVDTLADIEARLVAMAQVSGVQLNCLQSNAEHVLIDALHAARGSVDMVLINPGAFTHTSVALRDAFLATSLPFVEIHLSNIHAREAFRKHSYLSDIAIGVVCGFGAQSYEMALGYALARLAAKKTIS